MPTGYTAGILDGTINDFNEFAKLCVRNFGATIHMRDESFTKEWEPRKPTDYYKKEIEKAKALLLSYQTLPIEEIEAQRRAELEKERDYYIEKIKEAEAAAEKLNVFLAKAQEYTPPTTQHESIKQFMIQQLSETINHDGSTDYKKEQLQRIEAELLSIDPKTIREQKIQQAEENLKYNTDHHLKDVNGCAAANLWVEQFFASL